MPPSPSSQHNDNAKEYFSSRVQYVNSTGEFSHAYPHKFDVHISIPEFIQKYNKHPLLTSENGNEIRDQVVNLAGRISTKQDVSKKLHFIKIHGDDAEIQIIFRFQDQMMYCDNTIDEKTRINSFSAFLANFKRGDIVGVVGFPAISNSGEFSIIAHSLIMLSPCLHMIPDKDLVNKEQCYRQRYLDMIVNKRTTNTFKTRAKIIKFIRDFFAKLDFIEVETPTLHSIPGGAVAQPFISHHNSLNQQMFMRIAPELFLKQLVVGGFDRVFEIGKQFRNEDFSRFHHQEFSSIEAYWAYMDYNDMMQMTEQLLSNLVIHLFGTTEVKYFQNGADKTINFAPPFKKLYIIPELEKRLNVSFENIDFDSDKGNQFLQDLCCEHNIQCAPPLTTPRLFDALISDFLEPECEQPTFICDHPRIMSPLAKYHRNDSRLTERFELFVSKKELCNAYTELNNPLMQRDAFMKQMADRVSGDSEAMIIDESFLRALEHGLPPTGGWGMGIDRLVMLLTNNDNIKDVLFFPFMKKIDEKVNSNENVVVT
jgi:lysyl-tRNA synthetase class 2